MPLEREFVCMCVKNHGHPHSLSPELGREVEKRIQEPREKARDQMNGLQLSGGD